MIVRDFSFSNKYIHIDSQSLDFSKTGIYLIQGNNGVGKSSIINQVIFSVNKNVEMNTHDQQIAYDGNRSGLFAYVPQNIIIPSNVKVEEYVTKNNKSVDYELMATYFEAFGLNRLNLQTPVSVLSGGERSKLCIISALLKNTPYIIMDEPSNNLDDGSVSQLIHIVCEIAEKCTVIIISHDERVAFKDAFIIEITKDGAILQNEYEIAAAVNENKPNENIDKRLGRIGLSLQKSIPNVLTHILILIVFLAVFLYDSDEFVRNYNTEEKVSPDNIMVYQVDKVYDELNKVFTEGIGLSVSSDNYYNMITYDDIPKISNIDGISNILMLKESRLDERYDHIASEIINEDITDSEIISLPHITYEEYLDIVGIGDLLSLAKGRAPEDSSSEICLSEKRLDVLHCSGQLGQTIQLDGKTYTLVGITLYDIVWVSYQGYSDKNSLFYCYDEESYSDFKTTNLLFKQQNDYYNTNLPDDIFIITKSGSEKDVLCQLMSQFPANNYESSVFDTYWIREYNSSIIQRMILINLIVLCAIVLLWTFLTKSTIHEDYCKIMDYQNYYIVSDSLKKLYVFFYILFTIIGFVIEEFIFSRLIGADYFACSLLLALGMTLFTVVQTLILFKQINPRRHRRI